MFLNNKYSMCYNSIIERAKARSLGGYTEKHHIIPKCLGGSNNKENVVKLTAREHFICHRLLIHMVTGKAKYQMIKALDMMSVRSSIHHRYSISSKLYAKLKKDAAIAMSVLTKGKPKHTEEHKRKMSLAKLGIESHFKGKRHSESSKKLMALRRNKPCISPTGERFASTKDAAIAYGKSGPWIRRLIASKNSQWHYECNQ